MVDIDLSRLTLTFNVIQEYQHEAPWFPAQYELYTLAAYKVYIILNQSAYLKKYR